MSLIGSIYAAELSVKSDIDLKSYYFPYATNLWGQKANGLLSVSRKSENFNLFVSINTELNSRPGNNSFNLWETYIDIEFNNLILKTGQQFVSWTESFGLSNVDVINPSDLRESPNPFSPKTKIPIPMVSLKWLGDSINLESIVIPGGGNNWYPAMNDPVWKTFKDGIRQKADVDFSIDVDQIPRPFEFLQPIEYGLRMQNLSDGFDWAAYYFSHYDRTPIFYSTVTATAPLSIRLQPGFIMTDLFGLSFSNSLGAHVFRSELIYYPKRKVNVLKSGLDFTIETVSNYILVFGADLDLISHWRVGLQLSRDQYLSEHLIFISRNKIQDLIQLKLSRQFLDKYELGLAGTYAPQDFSYSLNSQLKWEFSDSIDLIAGYDYYGGTLISQVGRLNQTSKWSVTLNSKMEWLSD